LFSTVVLTLIYYKVVQIPPHICSVVGPLVIVLL